MSYINIYFLEGQATNLDYDNPAIIGNCQDGILVECGMEEASTLSSEWGLSAPLLARDGVHVSESGDQVFIANGEQVADAKAVAKAYGWEPGYGSEVADFLDIRNRIF